MAIQPSPETYRQEYYYMLALQRQQRDFGELLQRFPADQFSPEVLTALSHAHSVASARDPSHILDPDTMRDMRQTTPETFTRISPVYQEFLAEKAGLK